MRNKPEAVCTAGLIIVNSAVFLILSMFGNTEDAYFMLQHGAMYGPSVTEAHEFYRLVTCLFLHFGIQHLLNNMVMLGALGWNLEKEIGKMPVSCEVTEGDHLITIKHLTNFRWKKIQFRIKVYKHMDITAKFNPFWGTVKVYVDGERVHYSKK